MTFGGASSKPVSFLDQFVSLSPAAQDRIAGLVAVTLAAEARQEAIATSPTLSVIHGGATGPTRTGAPPNLHLAGDSGSADGRNPLPRLPIIPTVDN